MDNSYFITITGVDHFYGLKPFEVGRIIKLIKEPENEFDQEAILAFLPFIDKIGYVANSPKTVYKGTISAGNLYDKIEDYAYARIMFVTHSSAIAYVLDKSEVENDDNKKETPVVNDDESKAQPTRETNKIGFEY